MWWLWTMILKILPLMCKTTYSWWSNYKIKCDIYDITAIKSRQDSFCLPTLEDHRISRFFPNFPEILEILWLLVLLLPTIVLRNLDLFGVLPSMCDWEPYFKRFSSSILFSDSRIILIIFIVFLTASLMLPYTSTSKFYIILYLPWFPRVSPQYSSAYVFNNISWIDYVWPSADLFCST